MKTKLLRKIRKAGEIHVINVLTTETTEMLDNRKVKRKYVFDKTWVLFKNKKGEVVDSVYFMIASRRDGIRELLLKIYPQFVANKILENNSKKKEHKLRLKEFKYDKKKYSISPIIIEEYNDNPITKEKIGYLKKTLSNQPLKNQSHV